MDPKLKQKIDNASYEQLLRDWRHLPAGDPLFKGEVGEYYKKIMYRKKSMLPIKEQIQASKNVGWG